MINLTSNEIRALIESIGGNMNHIGEIDGKLVPMNNGVGLLHCIEDLMLINQQRDRIAELEREKAELVAQVESFKSALNDARQPHSSGSLPDFVSGWNSAIKLFEDIYLSTPTQCLNQIKADAGRAGFVAGWNAWQLKADVNIKSNEYAEYIAKGE